MAPYKPSQIILGDLMQLWDLMLHHYLGGCLRTEDEPTISLRPWWTQHFFCWGPQAIGNRQNLAIYTVFGPRDLDLPTWPRYPSTGPAFQIQVCMSVRLAVRMVTGRHTSCKKYYTHHVTEVECKKYYNIFHCALYISSIISQLCIITA